MRCMQRCVARCDSDHASLTSSTPHPSPTFSTLHLCLNSAVRHTHSSIRQRAIYPPLHLRPPREFWHTESPVLGVPPQIIPGLLARCSQADPNAFPSTPSPTQTAPDDALLKPVLPWLTRSSARPDFRPGSGRAASSTAPPTRSWGPRGPADPARARRLDPLLARRLSWEVETPSRPPCRTPLTRGYAFASRAARACKIGVGARC